MNEPTHIYKVVLNVSPDGSYQHNIFKSRVDSATKKHFILKKNYYRTRAEHVDRALIGAEPDIAVTLGFTKGSAWCLEGDVQATIKAIRTKMLAELFKEENRLADMRFAVRTGTPTVTERDTNEFD